MKKTRDVLKLEKPGGMYCNLENPVCKEHGKVYTDDGGYMCTRCGGRVPKWLPLVTVIERI